jgi:hypothetical protein
MNVFSDRTGRAVLVQDVGFPFTITLDGWPGAAALKAIVTNFGVSASGNYQFLHTLRNFVYVYVFGERMSEISVGGLAMASDCRQGAPSGMENLWDYYQRKKISTNGTPVSIAIGTRMSFQGYLIGFNATANDPGSGLSQWGMKLAFHPPEK